MKTPEKSLRAVIYTRVSSQGQADSGLGMDAQGRQARAYCEYRGLEVVEVIADPAVSGAIELRRRNGGKRLIELLPSVDAVVTTKLDRMFRNLHDCITNVRAWQKSGKSVIFLDVGIDTATPNGELLLNILASIAQWERQRMGERMKDALAEVKRRGGKIGPAGFGFRNLGHYQQAPNEDEKGAVELILSLRDDFSLREIAETLNESPWRPRGGRSWLPMQVKRVLERAAC